MNDIQIRFDIPDFRQQLKAIGSDFERKTIRSATGAAATVFKRLAVARAPVLKTENRRRGRIAGTLKRSIISGRSRRESKNGVEVYRVTVPAQDKRNTRFVRLDAFYWRFLEGGWMPRGPGRSLKGGNRSRDLQRRRAIAGGSSKVQYQFFAPAFSAGQGQALAVFNARIEKKIADYNRNNIVL